MRKLCLATMVIGVLVASNAFAAPVGPGGRIYLSRYEDNVTQLLRIDVAGDWTVVDDCGVIASVTNNSLYGGDKIKYVTSPEILHPRADEDGLATGGDGSVFMAGYYDNDVHVRYNKVTADGVVSTMHPGAGAGHFDTTFPGYDYRKPSPASPWTGGADMTAYVIDRKGEATQGPGSVAFFGAGSTINSSGQFTDMNANDRFDDNVDICWALGYSSSRCYGYNDIEIGGPGSNYNGTDNTLYFTSNSNIYQLTRKPAGDYGWNAQKKYYDWYDAYTTGSWIISPTSGMAVGDTDNDSNTDVYVLSSAAGGYKPFPRTGAAIFRLADLDGDLYVNPNAQVDLVHVFYDNDTLAGDLNNLTGEADLELVNDPTTGKWTLLILQRSGSIIAMELADNGDFVSSGGSYDPDGFHVVLDNTLTATGYSLWGMEFDADTAEAPPIPGDSNGDGKVDGGDLAIWQQNYDPLGGGNNTFALGDWNGDGKIDGGDLALWQQNYDPIGPTGADGMGANVPEPATLLLLGSGLLGAFGIARRRRLS